MGDISMIARRLSDGRVQYGWSGNGGYCRTVGAALLCWYNTPQKVEYLFGLGQVSLLAWPLDNEYEEAEGLYTKPIGRPHYWTDSERTIFGKIAFVDYVYFYDTDQRWYYIYSGLYNIKIPLETVWEYLARTGEYIEGSLFWKLHTQVFAYIAGELYSQDEEFRALASQHMFDPNQILGDTAKVLAADNVGEMEYQILEDLYSFFRDSKWIYNYLDDWVVAVPSKDGGIERLIIQKREEPRIETINWV